MRPSLVACSLLLLFALVSCQKEYLSKDERQALFAAPTTTELNDISQEWQGRNLQPTDYDVLQQVDLLSGAYTLKIVCFKTNNIRQYAALVIPDGTISLPVRVLVGGFGLGITTNSVNMVLDSSGGQANILAVPALRGQSLSITINGMAYTSPVSEGDHCDAFDGATDDVLALINLIEQTEGRADVSRSAVRGGSRGGTVALLAGIRDARVKRVVGVVTPTNMFELTEQNQTDDTYQCQFLQSYKSGQASLEATRRKLIASSPIYFAQHLPLTQLHMGLKDINVPVKQGYDLKEEMESIGNAAKFQLFIYDKTHADIATNNPALAERIDTFLSQL